ncbi:hypothetical protein D3C84_929230 [compost metagenome]
MKAAYEVRRAGDNGWIFQLKSGDNQVLLQSDSYRTLGGCLNGIESCREHSPYDRFYGRIESSLHFTFHVKASNNRVIGLGCASTSADERENAIGLVKRYAQIAQIIDCTK